MIVGYAMEFIVESDVSSVVLPENAWVETREGYKRVVLQAGAAKEKVISKVNDIGEVISAHIFGLIITPGSRPLFGFSRKICNR